MTSVWEDSDPSVIAARKYTGISNPQRPLVAFFIAFQTFGWIGITSVLFTALLSPSIKRHATWINFSISWIISCISYILPFLAAKQYASISETLCLTQAALIYAAPPLTACTTLALVIQLWFNIISTFSQKRIERAYLKTVSLLVVPYIVYITILTKCFADGIQNPNTVHMADSEIYCIITKGIPGKISAIVVASAMIASISFQFLIALFLYRHWHGFKSLESGQLLTMLIRVVMFSTFGLLSLAFSLAFLSEWDSPLPNIFMGMIPVAAVLIFGTQMDIFRVWMFWKKSPSEFHLEKPIFRDSMNISLHHAV